MKLEKIKNFCIIAHIDHYALCLSTGRDDAA